MVMMWCTRCRPCINKKKFVLYRVV